MDPKPTTAPVTVAELLPALVELASIQSDLLYALENPQPKGRSVFVAGPTGGMGPQPVAINVTNLRFRARALLQWLLERAKAPT